MSFALTLHEFNDVCLNVLNSLEAMKSLVVEPQKTEIDNVIVEVLKIIKNVVIINIDDQLNLNTSE